jgi:surface protein
MKKNAFLLALAIIFSCQLLTAQNFITQWNLATPGSGPTQLSIRTTTSGTVNYTWQQIPSGASGSGSWSGTPLTITGLPAGATIRLQIVPDNFQSIFMNYDPDCNRLTQVEQWGSTAWTSMANAFQGCTNLQVTATDVPNLSGVNSLSQMFEGCTNLNSPANINTWNIGTITNLSYMFASTNAFNQNIGSWNTGAVTNMQGLFYQASAFNQNIGSWNTDAVTNMFLMFYRASVFNQNISLWNTTAVTTMESMFSEANAFNQNIGSWNTTAVTNMSFMFWQASAFNQNIGSWNTAAVTDMSYMFYGASSFNQNIGNWNTTAVTKMNNMFREASGFNQNIGLWNTAAVTDMNNMFRGASAFNNGGSNSINNWNTVAVTNMSAMFGQASGFNQNIGSWNTAAVTNMSGMFEDASTFNQNIGGWNTGAVISMDFMFSVASAFNQNIGAWNTSAVTSMQFMFNSAVAFNQNIGAWNTAIVTNMNSMFSGASAFNRDIGSWTLNPAGDLNNMFDNSGMDCGSYSATLIGWNANPSTPNGRNLGADGRQYGTNAVAARTNLTGAKGWTITGDTPSGFSCVAINTNDFVTVWNLAVLGAPQTQITFGVATSGTVNYTWETIPASASGSGTFTGSTATITGLPAAAIIRLSIQPANFQRINIDGGTDRAGLILVENWGTTAWTSMQTAFRDCLNLQVTATDVPDLSGVTDMSKMFEACSILNSPGNINSWNTAAVTNMSNMFYGASSFNQNIGSWNTAGVTDMSFMFSSASSFNQNIGSWNTAAVTDMGGMFLGASSFNQNIGSWNTAAVTNMPGMFYGASSFNQNIGSWNTATVNHMASMFYGASAFNQNISSWNTAAVIYMNDIFNGASAFNQNIGSWTLNPVVDLSNMLDNSGMNCNNYSATLIGWNANPSTPNGRNLGATGRQYGTIAVAARSNLTGAKGWTITGDAPSGSSCSVILPVTWLYVNGQLQNGNALIKWATASESNTDKFEIEHSTDGRNYFKTGTKNAAGNSSSATQYEFIHPSPVAGKNFYRIKQIDIDGRFMYSSILVLQNSSTRSSLIIAPNPVQTEATLYFNEPGSKTIQLYSMNGAVLYTEKLNGENNRHIINMANITPGIYLLRVITAKGMEVHKIIKQ